MGCGCKNKQTQTQTAAQTQAQSSSEPKNIGAIHEAIKKTVEKYYNKK